ncbi:hypothetical protein RHA1_ro10331 (plasmid) [Rhodococcus jostii RHA1]|uniref:Uncharacterized protein n=1 Tax=Rhodococcus jostii (strain RHA1) TaxID=101510 RepID=Q0RW16_RHOJR|nr:hypothetical protein RHA1_ro10331 [Rhodococcus jostii RHA1]
MTRLQSSTDQLFETSTVGAECDQYVAGPSTPERGPPNRKLDIRHRMYVDATGATQNFQLVQRGPNPLRARIHYFLWRRLVGVKVLRSLCR